jgi:hypothetical protein
VLDKEETGCLSLFNSFSYTSKKAACPLFMLSYDPVKHIASRVSCRVFIAVWNPVIAQPA